MKKQYLMIVLSFVIFLSGCVVYSFYPLYTEEDLFANKILYGNWTDEENNEWSFVYQHEKVKDSIVIDSTSYLMTVNYKDTDALDIPEFSVHVINLQDHYFLDFYLEDFVEEERLELKDFHVIPVHTFAKLTILEDTLKINWYNQNWLKEMVENENIDIKYEDNGNFFLLTDSPKKIQKILLKYVNSKEAFKDGLEAVLVKK